MEYVKYRDRGTVSRFCAPYVIDRGQCSFIYWCSAPTCDISIIEADVEFHTQV